MLIERLEPDWEPTEGSDRQAGRVTTRLRRMRKKGRRVSGIVEYEADGTTWRHEFQSDLLDDDELDASLHDAGLTLSRVLDDKRRWVEARPAGRTEGLG